VGTGEGKDGEQEKEKIILKTSPLLDVVAHNCNPTYSGSRDKNLEFRSSRSA
jgi:hypothetical protein